MVRTAIQLYSLRSLDAPVPDLVRRVAETTFDGVEFAGLGESSAHDVAVALANTNVAAAAGHVGLHSLETNFTETCTTYSMIGCETLVVPYLEHVHFEDEAAIHAAASRMNAIARNLAEWDIRLCYHNHDHEFTTGKAGRAFDILVGALDDQVGIELDVGWVVAAGYDPIPLLERLNDRVPLVHLKDVDAAGSPVDLGSGVVDLQGCAESAVRAGADWLIYEHDDPVDPVHSLGHGARTLAALREELS